MTFHFHLGEHASDPAGLVDHDRRAFDSHALASEELLLFPHTVSFTDVTIGIREKWKGYAEPFLETLVASHGVFRNAEDDRIELIEVGQPARETPRFRRSARGHVPGVEVEHDPLAREVGQPNVVTLGRWQVEVRSWVAYDEFAQCSLPSGGG